MLQKTLCYTPSADEAPCFNATNRASQDKLEPSRHTPCTGSRAEHAYCRAALDSLSEGMISRLPFLAALTLLLTPSVTHAANRDQEYQQVREIALRDPKVRAAYEAADRRLEEKIVRIDPALESYVRNRSARGRQVAPSEHRVTAPEHRATAPSARRTQPAAATGIKHRVAQGETLTSIAAQHGVSVAAVKSANHNPDEKHLKVGQVLVIPSSH
jgi:hypothetical protein